MQQRIKNSPKEKEYLHFCVGKILIGWKREKQIFIVNKMGRRRVKKKLKEKKKDEGI